MTVKVPVSLTDFEELVRPVTVARLNGVAPPPTKIDNASQDSVVDNNSANVEPEVDPPTPDPPKIEVDPPEPEVIRIADDTIKSLMKQGAGSLSAIKGAQDGKISIMGDETIDGKDYQVGVLKYKKNTLLGMRELSVKALIADGEIQKWVWSESGQEVSQYSQLMLKSPLPIVFGSGLFD